MMDGLNNQAKEIISGVFVLCFGILLWFVVPIFVSSTGSETDLGPTFFPRFVAVGLTLCGILLLVKELGIWISSRSPVGEDGASSEEPIYGAEEDTEEEETESKPLVAMSVFIIMAIYTFVVPFAGFLLSTIVSMSIIMWILDVRKWYLYILLILFILGVQYVFQNLLFVFLP